MKLERAPSPLGMSKAACPEHSQPAIAACGHMQNN